MTSNKLKIDSIKTVIIMSKINHTTKTKYNHLTIMEFFNIETLLNETKSIQYILAQLGYHQLTVDKEIKCG